MVLRDSRSISPDCRAVKRSLADSGTNLTLVGSLKMAAATARQMSTSIPVQLPLSSGAEKPGQSLAYAAGDHAAVLDRLESLRGRRLGRKTRGESKGKDKGNTFHGEASKVVREGWLVDAGKMGQPELRHRKCRPGWAYLPLFRLKNAATIAAGPSTLQRSCNLYHRTTGGPGQGVDAGLPCPAISQNAVFRCLANFFTLPGGRITMKEAVGI